MIAKEPAAIQRAIGSESSPTFLHPLKSSSNTESFLYRNSLINPRFSEEIGVLKVLFPNPMFITQYNVQVFRLRLEPFVDEPLWIFR